MAPRKQLAITHPMYAFGLTWLGQLISVIGSGLSSFALGVEVYQRTGSTTQFSLVSLASMLPMTVMSPIAGALVDRWDRRRAMLFSDLGAGLGSFAIWLLLAAGHAGRWRLQLWHLYPPLALVSALGAFRWPAYYSTATLLASKQHLGRVSGMIELASAVGQIIAPVLAGSLVPRIGLKGIVLIDLATFLFSAGTLLFVRFPRPPTTEAGQAGKGSLWQEIAQGWLFIQERPGLLGLLLFNAVTNLHLGLVMVLVTPLILSFTGASTLGMIMSISGLGMLAGGIMMSVWGGPRRRILGVLGFSLLSGVALLVAALPATVLIATLGVSLFLFTMTPYVGCFQAIWQSKVAPDLQGRVLSVRRMVAMSAPPVSALLAGPLADKIFEPWLTPGGALASTIGRVMGTGPGRGISFLFIILGVLTMVNVFIAYLNPRVRNVEDELPDAIPDPSPRISADGHAPSADSDPGTAPALTPESGS